MPKHVDALIYSGVDRAERGRIGKGLAEAREKRAAIEREIARLRQRGDELSIQLTKEFATTLKARPALRLLACPDCHRPTTLCICMDAEGQPLAWGHA